MAMRSNGHRVAVVMGGAGAEREVSLYTGSHVNEALLSRGHDAVAIDWTERESLLPTLREAGASRVWIALHGARGEDGCVQGLLECERIPYTGSGVLASALGMDKVASRRIFESSGIPVPRWTVHRSARDAERIGFPAVVKPARQGSSLGVTFVEDARSLPAAVEAARRFGDDVLVEEYVAGRELSIAVLDGAVLGTVEIEHAGPIFDVEAKYRRPDHHHLCPAPLDASTDERVRRVALSAHHALGCSGLTRTDVRLGRDGRPHVLEVNTLPGCGRFSLVTRMAREAGLSFEDLVERVLATARLHARQSSCE